MPTERTGDRKRERERERERERDQASERLSPSSKTMGWVSMRGRSLASSSSSSSKSMVLRVTHENRSRDAKKADATLDPKNARKLGLSSIEIKKKKKKRLERMRD